MKRNMKQKGRDLLSLALCAAMLLSMMAFPAAGQEMTEQNPEEASSTNFEALTTTEGAVNTGTATETSITEGEITSTTDSTYTLNTPLLNNAYYGTAITSDYKDLLSDPLSDGCVYSFVNAGSERWVLKKANFLSGYEVNYNPEMWNNPDAASHDVQSATNCYNYALNFYSEMIEHFIKVYYDIIGYDEETGVVTYSPKGIRTKIINSYATLQPGIFDGESNDDEYLGEFVDIIALLQAVQEDSAVADFTFTEISQYDICPEGTYKVALIYGTDYHWYRQNSDGTWSHKPGTTEVTNLDAHGNIIFDPLYACSDTNYYTHFAGYYAVSAVVYECLIYGSLESFLSQ